MDGFDKSVRGVAKWLSLRASYRQAKEIILYHALGFHRLQ
jgi:hypothetical protein